MDNDNRWAKEAYPDEYRRDVSGSLAFSGLSMDMFTRGKVDNMVDVLRHHSVVPAATAACLDIGCGIGAAHPLLCDRVGALSGADVSADAIETARSSNPSVEYRSYEPPRLPYPDAQFDFCTTSCVIHHVPPAQWQGFVNEAYRVARPGGLFTVYEHNPFNPLTRVAVWRCPFDHDAVLLRPRRVIHLMRAAGFQIVLRKYLFFVPVDAAWARRVDRLLGWLPLGAQYVVCGRKPG